MEEKRAMTVDIRAFRDTLGCFPTGIAIMTTVNDAHGPVGVTVSSFTAAPLRPPIRLCRPVPGSRLLVDFRRCHNFAVNFLSETQRDLSNRFASKAEKPFDGVRFARSERGLPLFPGSLAYLECQVEALHPGGDHDIILGQVIGFENPGDGRPLLYYRGGYRLLDAEAAV